MRAEVSTDELKKALERVGTAATGKHTIPIIGSVRLEAVGTQLILACTDLELFIQDKITARVKEAGTVVISYRLLSNFINRATAKETVFGYIEEDFAIRHGENAGKFQSLPEGDWPDRTLAGTETVQCKTEEFIKPLRLVMHAMSGDDKRYVLMGINLSGGKAKNSFFAATDGNRLSVCESDLQLADDTDIIIPDATAKALTKLIGDQDGELEIKFAQGAMSVRCGSLEVDSRLVEGSYPNYGSVIPKASDHAFSAERKDLAEAIHTASVFLVGGEMAVTIAGKKKQLEVSCFDRFRTRLTGGELNGQPQEEVRFNHRYLIDALEVCAKDQVRIEVSPNAPCVIREGKLTEVINPLVKP